MKDSRPARTGDLVAAVARPRTRFWRDFSDVPILLQIIHALVERGQHLRQLRNGKLIVVQPAANRHHLRLLAGSETSHWHVDANKAAMSHVIAVGQPAHLNRPGGIRTEPLPEIHELPRTGFASQRLASLRRGVTA